WAGVAFRTVPWGLDARGLWRASSTVTYPNATAAVLVPVCLLALAMRTRRGGSPWLGLATTGLLAGLAVGTWAGRLPSWWAAVPLGCVGVSVSVGSLLSGSLARATAEIAAPGRPRPRRTGYTACARRWRCSPTIRIRR
ncbi:MAG TPA: hypothetical protein VFX70_21575, partial [Mycobacteriales bacterium]|nr:hypothetical protein [Mycobacteriales bacterium]